jgi:hypothetical protein
MDLKPDNVLIVSNEEVSAESSIVSIIDYGLAYPFISMENG